MDKLNTNIIDQSVKDTVTQDFKLALVSTSLLVNLTVFVTWLTMVVSA